MKAFIRNYIIFFKIGLVTIGGGYAMLPVIEREMVKERTLARHEDVLDSYALAQTIPGIIAVNTAVFLGYRQGKLKLALANALGVITPSMIIITLIAALYREATKNPLFGNIFAGVRVAVVALLIMTVVKLAKRSIKDYFTALLGLAGALGILLFHWDTPLVILAGGLASILYYQTRGAS